MPNTIQLQAEKVKGFTRLGPAARQMFKQFLRVYMSQWEHPEKHWPVKVAVKHDRSNGHYLRVDFSGDYWLHVRNAYTWY